MTFSPSNGSDWMLNEAASAGRENLDPHHVTRYDSIEDAHTEQEVALLRSLGVNATSLVVDMGAGTGQLTCAVAPHCQRVVAVDISPQMIDALRAKIAHSALTNVDVVHAGFLSYAHQGPQADVVYSRYALHHLPDFWKGLALTRMRDCLKPGGIVRLWDVVYDFEPADIDRRIEQWCAAYPDSAGDGWRREDVAEHVRDEHSTFSWAMEALITRAGFTIQTADYSDEGIDAKYILQRASPNR